MNTFGILAGMCGLSHQEAADYLKVRLDTAKSWASGRREANDDVIAELRGLLSKIVAAGKKIEAAVRGGLGRLDPALHGLGIALMPERDARQLDLPGEGPLFAAVGQAITGLSEDLLVLVEERDRGVGGSMLTLLEREPMAKSGERAGMPFGGRRQLKAIPVSVD